MKTWETITSFEWTTLLHPPYSSDSVPSDNHLISLIKEGFRDKHYAGSEETKTAIMNWLKEQSTKFHEAEIHALIRRWNIATERNGNG